MNITFNDTYYVQQCCKASLEASSETMFDKRRSKLLEAATIAACKGSSLTVEMDIVNAIPLHIWQDKARNKR